MLRKLKWQIPGELLAAQNNWCQGPVPGHGPTVEKHCSRWPRWNWCQWRHASVVNSVFIVRVVRSWDPKQRRQRANWPLVSNVAEQTLLCNRNVPSKTTTQHTFYAWIFFNRSLMLYILAGFANMFSQHTNFKFLLNINFRDMLCYLLWKGWLE